MGNPSASTLDAAKHTNVVSNKVTPWSSNPLISIDSDDAKANSLGDHPSTVTYGFTVKSLISTSDFLQVNYQGWGWTTLSNQTKYKI